MALSSTIRWFHSEQLGAPQIMAVQGNILSILDACLLNGFGAKAAASITVTNGLAVVSIPSGCDFEVYSVINVSGCSVAELNGDWKVSASSSVSVSFSVAIADCVGGGTITVKRAATPYWEKQFSGTNKAAYRSVHPDSSRCVFYIESVDYGTSYVRGYESMTDIATGVRPFPTLTQQAASTFIWKQSNTNNVAYMPRKWMLIADERAFYLITDWAYTITAGGELTCFGDLARHGMLDHYACLIAAETTSAPSYPHHVNQLSRLNGTTGLYLPRPMDQSESASAPNARLGGYRDMAAGGTYVGSGVDVYPSPLTGGYLFAPLFVIDGATNANRGEMAGYFQSLTTSATTLGTATRVVIPAGSVSDQPFLLCKMADSSTTLAAVFQIGGSWR